MATIAPNFERISHPIDLIESLALQNGWPYERTCDDELTLSVDGSWCDYQLSINWRDDIESLHLACAFDLKIPDARINEIYRLIAKINEQLWVGHFDLWSDDGLLMYRHALLLNGAEPNVEQCEALMTSALESCEFYYQAFQFVIWAGTDATDALATTMFETKGQA
ncbi:MAG: YbjN domain-containing protein [Hyphomicrobiaceae bacterium]|nr:YbjN domain-containing protein [Hyphomicrobiaceae bacterium]